MALPSQPGYVDCVRWDDSRYYVRQIRRNKSLATLATNKKSHGRTVYRYHSSLLHFRSKSTEQIRLQQVAPLHLIPTDYRVYRPTERITKTTECTFHGFCIYWAMFTRDVYSAISYLV